MSSYANFFVGSTTVAGALVGLLYVALSVAPERLRGTTASAEHQAIAATAFTALVDALFLSLAALFPGNALPGAGFTLGLIGLTSTAGLVFRLWRSRESESLSRRWPYLLSFIVLVYGAQVGTAITTDRASAAQALSARFAFILFGIGIARSWELLGLRGGGLLDLLVTHAHRATNNPPPGQGGRRSNRSGDGRGSRPGGGRGNRPGD